MSNPSRMADKRQPRARDGAEVERGATRGGGDRTGLVTFLVGGALTAFLFWTLPYWPYNEPYQFVNSGVCLWLPLLVILLGLRQEPAHFGLSRGDRKLGMRWAMIAWAAMILPVAYYAHRPDAQHTYLGRLSVPLAVVGAPYEMGRVHLPALLYYELGMGFYLFAWEFFFRGFLLFGLSKTRLGTWGAVIFQALPFALLHWSWMPGASKPLPEVMGSLAAGILLGMLAVRTRSMLYGYLAHWSVSVMLDLFLLVPFIFHRIG